MTRPIIKSGRKWESRVVISAPSAASDMASGWNIGLEEGLILADILNDTLVRSCTDPLSSRDDLFQSRFPR